MSERFRGFSPPTSNYSKLPHEMVEQLPNITSLGEMKVLLYILRHTWGFQDDSKKITLDEFESGRKRRDGSRLDGGTGLSKPTIIDGLRRCVEHGYITVEKGGDPGRKERYYSLADVKDFNYLSKESLHRTEKETKDKYITSSVSCGEPPIVKMGRAPWTPGDWVTANQIAKADATWRPSDQDYNPRAPQTPAGRYFIETFNAERRANGKPASAKYLPSVTMREQLEEWERRYGEQAIKDFVLGAITSGKGQTLQQLFGYVRACVNNRRNGGPRQESVLSVVKGGETWYWGKEHVKVPNEDGWIYEISSKTWFREGDPTVTRAPPGYQPITSEFGVRLEKQ